MHGCFWHGHDCARGSRKPKQNADYWAAKIGKNLARDADVSAQLAAAGWRVITLWECGLKAPDAAARLVAEVQAATVLASSSVFSSART